VSSLFTVMLVSNATESSRLTVDKRSMDYAIRVSLWLLEAQITDVNLAQAHCLSSRTPTLVFFFLFHYNNPPKVESLQFKNASESNLNFLLYCNLKLHNKANREWVGVCKGFTCNSVTLVFPG
jgi:hypothetical protein